MPRRLVIRSDGGSPILVSAAGYDADSAGFENVIFNGNQQPLRLSNAGYMIVNPNNTGSSDGVIVVPLPSVTPGPGVSSNPPGVTSIFVLMVRRGLPTGGTSGDLQTPFSNFNYPRTGVGGMIFNNQMFGINFQEHYGALTFGSAYLNYLVFKNSG